MPIDMKIVEATKIKYTHSVKKFKDEKWNTDGT